MRKRADSRSCGAGLFSSRARAQAAIAAGLVSVGGVALGKASAAVAEDAEITAGRCLIPGPRAEASSWPPPSTRSRSIPPASSVSTSAPRPEDSPTCCWRAARRKSSRSTSAMANLRRGWRGTTGCVSLEGLDARALTRERIGESPGAIVSDLSFISQRLVLPHVLALGGWVRVAGQPGQAAIRGRPGRDRKGQGEKRAGARSRLPGCGRVHRGAWLDGPRRDLVADPRRRRGEGIPDRGASWLRRSKSWRSRRSTRAAMASRQTGQSSPALCRASACASASRASAPSLSRPWT